MFARILARRLNKRKMTTQQWIESDAGPKTIHFWAPAWKWSLVFAGIGDYFRLVLGVNFLIFFWLIFCSILNFQTGGKVIPESVGIFDCNRCNLVALLNGCNSQKQGLIFRQFFPGPNWGDSNRKNLALSIN